YNELGIELRTYNVLPKPLTTIPNLVAYAVRGLFTKLPPLVRAVLMSRPFWSGLVSILVWITCRHFKKRSPDLVTRYIRRGKWLVDCAQKLITYKKANEAHSRRQLQS
ncbi:NBS resistance protein, partial [Trifolium medium]|nr:NBS resistance protein [Trifolium medium]